MSEINQVILLDGSMGRELRARGVDIPHTIWSANALIAGSLPPLRASYRPDLVGPDEEITPLYKEQAAFIAPYVDMIICETMSCAREGVAAAKALKGLPVTGILYNCSSPEALSAGMEELASLPVQYKGAYANAFVPVADNRTPDGRTVKDDAVSTRDDLSEQQYVRHAQTWLYRGANVIGGCCGVGPSYIAELKGLIST